MACDVEVARGAHRLYGLTLPAADEVIDGARAAVRTWRNEAEALRIGRSEQDKMASAFGE